MQSLTEPPRSQLTRQQVVDILHLALRVRPGLDLLDRNDRFVADITDELLDGSVARQNYATVHGACTLQITRRLQWGRDRVRPYVRLWGSRANVEARFNLGIYVLATAPHRYGSNQTVYTVNGYDKIHFLNRPVGDTWVSRKGARHLDEVRRAIRAAGETKVLLDDSKNEAVLRKDRVWPLVPTNNIDQDNDTPDTGPTTWLRVVNDLLAAINYQGIWVDHNGYFRSGPYVDHAERPLEYTFDAGDHRLSIVDADFLQSDDVYNAPNAWRWIRRNPPEGQAPVDGNGIHTFRNLDRGPSSIQAVGYEQWRVEFVDAEDHEALVRQAEQAIAADIRNDTKLEIATGIFPLAGHFDVYRFVHPQVGVQRVVAHSWELDLGLGHTRHVWEVVR